MIVPGWSWKKTHTHTSWTKESMQKVRGEGEGNEWRISAVIFLSPADYFLSDCKKFDLTEWVSEIRKMSRGRRKNVYTYVLVDITFCITRVLRRFSILILLYGSRPWDPAVCIHASTTTRSSEPNVPLSDATGFRNRLCLELSLLEPDIVRLASLILDHGLWIRVRQDPATGQLWVCRIFCVAECIQWSYLHIIG